MSQIEPLADEELDNTIVKSIVCVIPYVPHETLLASPTTLASCLYEVSPLMRTKIVDLLTQYIIPLIYAFMTIDIDDEMADINLSVPAMLSSILDATSDAGLWTKAMECLMRFKRTVSTDLLTVLAYGTRESLEASVHLLNRYFPPIDIGNVQFLYSKGSLKNYVDMARTTTLPHPYFIQDISSTVHLMNRNRGGSEVSLHTREAFAYYATFSPEIAIS